MMRLSLFWYVIEQKTQLAKKQDRANRESI